MEYRKKVNSETGIIYNHRKNYDEAVQQINRTMARYIDRKQVDAQEIYPHYFERYKTDGVEHNIYIGAAHELIIVQSLLIRFTCTIFGFGN